MCVNGGLLIPLQPKQTIMARKRRKTLPRRLEESKRACMTWNMNEPLHLSCNDDDLEAGFKHENVNRPKQNEQTWRSSLFVVFNKKQLHKIRIGNFVIKDDYLKDEKHGALIGELQFKSDEICKSKEFFVSSRDLFLVVNEENSSDHLQAGISELISGSNSAGKIYDEAIFNTIYSGSLLSCKEIIKSLEFLVRNQKLKLILCMQNAAERNFSLLVELIMSEKDDEMIELDGKRCGLLNGNRYHMKLLMKYFYDDLNTIEAFQSKKIVCYSGDEIQHLYDYIMNYHNEKFNMMSNKEEQNDSGLSFDTSNGSNTDEDVNSPSNISEDVPEEKFSITSNNDESNQCDDYSTEIDDEFDGIICKNKEKSINHASLLPSLRQYQQEAVKWMIAKENTDEYEKDDPKDHVLWKKLLTVDGKIIYYNKFTGRLASKISVAPLPRGGILADEMGLGKTVEVLALILNNPREQRFAIAEETLISPEVLREKVDMTDAIGMEQKPDNVNEILWCGICENEMNSSDRTVSCSKCKSKMHFKCAGTLGKYLKEYHCIACTSKKIIDTHCTLIVSPEAIFNQWIEEIKRHVKHGTIKYLLYRGVAKDGFIQPAVIAEYDVIVTTYSALRADLYHVQAEEAKSRLLRHRKKYTNLPSPLMYLNFWRICLDEAQMIQSTTTRTAEMTLRINASHRWCVTGTPIQKGLEDIYGMLLFVGVYPYCLKVWWKKLLYEPLMRGDNKPLFELLSRVMWRTEKKNVLDQINLPQQTEQLNHLKFSPVERHFYQKQEEVCMANSLKEIRRWDAAETVLSDLDKSSLHKLLAPLLRLRQACCHPHVVRGGILPIKKSHLSMEKLLERLTAKAKLECVESHRQLMCAINGLAAVDQIQNKFSDAVKKYREAIQSWAAHEDMFKTDTLQKLHTLKNMAESLTKSRNCFHFPSDQTSDGKMLSSDEKNRPSKFNSLVDCCLGLSVEELTKDYMKKNSVRVVSAQEALAAMEENLQKSKDNIDWQNPWWIRVLSHFQNARQETEEEFVRKFKLELGSERSFSDSIRSKFSTIDGLQYILTSKLDSIMELRQKLLQGIETLKGEPTKETILKTAECCLRPVEGGTGSRCIFCKVDDLFIEYENRIFTHRGAKFNRADENTRLGGLRAETEVDIVFKILHVMTRQFYFDAEIREQGKTHLNYMDLLKQEFKCLRQLWFALHQRISAHDELEMSAIRLRLRYAGEETDERYVIDRHDIIPQRLKLQSDKIIAEEELRRKKGQLLYLKNLEKAQNTEDGSNPELCPICTKVLGYEWAVFSCGHCFCCECVYILERQYTGNFSSARRGAKIKCALCRATTLSENISFVVMDEDRAIENADINVKGSYSVKIEAVVRKILEIDQKDPDGKVLVFSTWCDVLEIISKALLENDVIHRNGSKSKKAFQAGLVDFKTMDTVKVILLPLKSGSKGLNIIEATHVILVEPTLNPSNEHQAIGRVHRIGQTKPTFVHRFLVKKTVEERICHLLKRKSSDLSVSDETNIALTIADVSTLLSNDGICKTNS